MTETDVAKNDVMTTSDVAATPMSVNGANQMMTNGQWRNE